MEPLPTRSHMSLLYILQPATQSTEVRTANITVNSSQMRHRSVITDTNLHLKTCPSTISAIACYKLQSHVRLTFSMGLQFLPWVLSAHQHMPPSPLVLVVDITQNQTQLWKKTLQIKLHPNSMNYDVLVFPCFYQSVFSQSLVTMVVIHHQICRGSLIFQKLKMKHK